MSHLKFETPVTTIAGEPATLEPYKGDVLLIVNTASRCGLTPQLEGLEQLHQEFGDRGLRVLGFPCNQFLSQDPGTNDEIALFCQRNYGVDFPMFAKIDVNGDNTHALFQQLKAAAPGAFGSQAVKWNFTKFLVGRDGKILRRYSPTTEPRRLREDIESALSEH